MKVASFNIQKFGQHKLLNPNTLATLVKVQLYDSIRDLIIPSEKHLSNYPQNKDVIVHINKSINERFFPFSSFRPIRLCLAMTS